MEALRGHQRFLKRGMDLMLTGATTPLWAPLAGILALLILLSQGHPVLFRQVRPGLHGRPFTLFKFRTMTQERDRDGRLLPDEARLTRIGRLLRALSLDELPTLWNVLRGDMSLIGPRPLLMEYLVRYTSQQARRHEVQPGITGWAQVNGRNALSWEEKFRLDVWYLENMSVWLDLKILWLTLVKVLRREGISADGYATMPEFVGSPSPGHLEKDAEDG